MANRLTQIATRTGDNGTTGLGDNTRVSKNSLRVHAMGDVDELNSNIGVLLCEDMAGPVRELLVEIQHQLFNLGGRQPLGSTEDGTQSACLHARIRDVDRGGAVIAQHRIDQLIEALTFLGDIAINHDGRQLGQRFLQPVCEDAKVPDGRTG